MLKSLKDARRRAVESLLETVGASEVTTDHDFDNYSGKFDAIILDLNQCSVALTKYLTSQTTMFNDAKELSIVTQRVYQATSQETTWPENHLLCTGGAESYKQAWERIHDTIRASAHSLSLDRGVEPLKENSVQLNKTIEEEIRVRKACLKDFDSYRRRLKALEQKRDGAEAQGKGNTPAHADTLAEIQRFEAKVQTAGEHYHTENAKTKTDILSAKERHDQLIDDFFITTIVTQAELLSQAADQLESIIKTLPKDKVSEVRSRMKDLIASGGATLQSQPKKSLLSAVSSPKASDTPKSTFSSSTSITATTTPNPPPQPSQTNVGGQRKEYAIALYDNDVDDDEELAFKTGQRIEVIEKDDSGWYKGRLNGREGLFPVNYVKLE